jgi:hypothetical protein
LCYLRWPNLDELLLFDGNATPADVDLDAGGRAPLLVELISVVGSEQTDCPALSKKLH